MEWIIYKHTSPSGHIYIGQTCKKPNYRWANGNGYLRAPKFWSAIKKYGWNNIEHEIIEEGIKSQEEADAREIFWINHYNSFRSGYNATAGGGTQIHTSSPVFMISKTTLEILKGFPSAAEAARVMSCAQGLISSVCRGERIEAKGYYWCYQCAWSQDWKPRRRVNNKAKKVYQIDEISLVIVKTYDSVIAAVKSSGLTKATIENCCKNQYLPKNGYYYLFEEDWYDNWSPRKKTPSKHGMREVICIESGEIYGSLGEAARKNNTSTGNIFVCCNNHKRTIGGLHFCYKDDYEDFHNRVIERAIRKSVRCIEIGTVFESVSEASRVSGISQSQISNCCSGKNVTAGDLHWCFENDYDENQPLKKGKKKKVMCIETGMVYSSQAEAFRKTGIRHITECCKRQIPLAGGFHWCYESDFKTWKPVRKRNTKKVICVETGAVYNSIKDAAKNTGANYTEIGNCCKNPHFTTGGYHWRYANDDI